MHASTPCELCDFMIAQPWPALQSRAPPMLSSPSTTRKRCISTRRMEGRVFHYSKYSIVLYSMSPIRRAPSAGPLGPLRGPLEGVVLRPARCFLIAYRPVLYFF